MAVRKDLNNQFVLTLPNELDDQVNEFWHEERMSNRNDGVRELIRLGLEYHKLKKDFDINREP